MQRQLVAALLIGIASCAGGGAKPATPARAETAHPVEPPPVVVAAPPDAHAPPAFPDTPAAKLASTWLEVFNSADERRMQDFAAHNQAAQEAVDAGFRQQTGGFELLEIQKSERLAIQFVVKEKASPTTAVGWLRVKDSEPAEISSFTLLAIPPGMTAGDMTIHVDAATRAAVIDAIEAKLTELYIYPEGAKQMVQAVRDHQKKGDYDAIDEGPELASQLTEHLRAVSHDRHLGIDFVPEVVPEGEHEPNDEDKARMRERLEHMNCGFVKTERLDGNIGYVKFNMFADVDICGPKVTEQLGSLGDVDAVIFDMRDNGGGQPAMVAFVISYLFDKRTHLNDIYERKDKKTTQYWTKPDVPGKKLAKQPVYVLASAHTFSGAEEFCYDLKNLKRATIVGETTGGGAHPTAGKRLAEHFMIAVPFARAINPITKTDWEGTGVEPDVKVPADQALETAKKLAAERIATKHR